VWSTPRRNASEQTDDLRKAELFINNRLGEEDEADGTFTCMELWRYA
jgi:hypothetical protein